MIRPIGLIIPEPQPEIKLNLSIGDIHASFFVTIGKAQELTLPRAL